MEKTTGQTGTCWSEVKVGSKSTSATAQITLRIHCAVVDLGLSLVKVRQRLKTIGNGMAASKLGVHLLVRMLLW